jgi:Methyltransferase FkbM domain
VIQALKAVLSHIWRRGGAETRWVPNRPPSRTYYSQANQDRWVVERVFGEQRYHGYFVEMGAADGILLSNTYVLERDFGWTGLLVEPTDAFERLKVNRKANLEHTCVAAESKEVYLAYLLSPGYVDQDKDNRMRSFTIDAENENEALRKAREELARQPDSVKKAVTPEALKVEKVRSVSFAELLDKHQAPSTIDYFSLDVEGYEYEILRRFPFDRYRFSCMTIERPERALQDLLSRAGYLAVSRNDVGDVYYIHNSLKKQYRAASIP